jgi:hypothetical protein
MKLRLPYLKTGRDCGYKISPLDNIYYSEGEMRISPLMLWPQAGPLGQPYMMDERNGAFGGIRIGTGNRSSRLGERLLDILTCKVK